MCTVQTIYIFLTQRLILLTNTKASKQVSKQVSKQERILKMQDVSMSGYAIYKTTLHTPPSHPSTMVPAIRAASNR